MECSHCHEELENDDQVYSLEADTPYKGYVHDECLAEFLYDQLGPYPMRWSKIKELDGIEE